MAFQISACFTEVHSLMRVTVPSSSTEGPFQHSAVGHPDERRMLCPSNILFFGESPEEGTGGSRLSDKEEQMFLPCSLGRDRSHDHGAQRQREAGGSQGGVHGALQSREVPWSMHAPGPVLPHLLQALGQVP